MEYLAIMKNKIPRQVIFVVESKKETDSDGIYINEILKFYYGNFIKENEISIKYIPMKGKNHFNHRDVKEKLKKLIEREKNSEVIYVFDKDNATIDANDSLFNEKVTKYCKNNKYKLVWFVKNIEEVLLKKSSSKKTEDAVNFRNKKMIENIKTSVLLNKNPISKRVIF